MHRISSSKCQIQVPASPVVSGQSATPLSERLERALVLLAYFIEVDGDVYVPLYEKLEIELSKLHRHAETRTRARQRLSAYQRSGRPEGNAFEKLEL